MKWTHWTYLYTQSERDRESQEIYLIWISCDRSRSCFIYISTCLLEIPLNYVHRHKFYINFFSLLPLSFLVSFSSSRLVFFFSLCRFYYLDIYWYNFSFSPFDFYVALFSNFFLAWMEKWTKECTGVLTFLEWVCVCVSCLLLSFQRSSIIQSDQSIEINTKKLQNIP